MAYSDYGGYAYRNGKHIEDRSDCTITAEGDTFGTPGVWPGFAKYLIGDDAKNWPSGHVVLGDGPIYVVLYKQSATSLYRGPEELDDIEHLDPEYQHLVKDWKLSEGQYIDVEDGHFVLRVDDCRIDVTYEWADNHYQYVKLTQPDGTVWCGFSGYGVGAGLEDAGYGYSTERCIKRLRELYPEAFNLPTD